MLWWLIWSALAGPALTTRDMTGSRVAALQTSEKSADMIVVYASEQHGEIGPCGCNDYPMGGMARIERYADRLTKRETDAVVLKLYAGGAFLPPISSRNLLTHTLQRHQNEAMAEVLERGGWDAVNLTCDDLESDRSWALPSGALSTNVTRLGGDLSSRQVIERGGVTTLVLGVTGSCDGGAQREGWLVSEPLRAVQDALAVREEHIDRVVVLTHRVGDAVSSIARLDGVDIVIESDGFTARYPPVVPSGRAVWVRTWQEAERLGELRLDWDNEGKLLHAQDSAIGLAPGLRGTRWVERLVDEVATSGGPG